MDIHAHHLKQPQKCLSHDPTLTNALSIGKPILTPSCQVVIHSQMSHNKLPKFHFGNSACSSLYQYLTDQTCNVSSSPNKAHPKHGFHTFEGLENPGFASCCTQCPLSGNRRGWKLGK